MAGALTSTHRTYLRYTFFACFAFFFTATLSYLFAAHPADTSATTVGFNPGNIMNDYTMSNYSTMTEAEIQSFLKSKNPCNDTNLSKADYYKQQGFAYHIKDGHFVCMADELFDGVNVGSGETAAHIIYDVSQTYRINPQVLIVLLEKEQGLVTDTWPNYSHQYKTATGYGCPDTAACDSQYFGLRNQLENAAGMFRKLLNGGGNNLYPVGWRDVAYKDRAPWCGSAHIYIENIATGILYTYTPYTPNAAALAAGTGLGDSCSAYGNRNFYHYFTEWFGSTQTGLPQPANGQGSAVSDIEWRALDTPRYLEPAKGTAFIIDLKNSTSTQNTMTNKTFFTQKSFLTNGDMCLRSDDMPVDYCVLYSSLREATWQKYPLETPRGFVVNSEQYFVNPSTNQQGSRIEPYRQYYFTDKILLSTGEWCLVHSETACAPLSSLLELDKGWIMLENPREMILNIEGYKININTGKQDTSIFLFKGMRRKYITKKLLGATWCLRTEYDHDLDTDNCIKLDMLRDI